MKRLAAFLPRRKSQTPALPSQEDHDAHIYMGNMYLSLGQYAQAEAEYLRAHAASPSDESKNQLRLVQLRRRQPIASAPAVAPIRRAA